MKKFDLNIEKVLEYSEYKLPSLHELHIKLFNKPIEQSHNALLDVETCAKCFFELMRRGIIKNPAIPL